MHAQKKKNKKVKMKFKNAFSVTQAVSGVG